MATNEEANTTLVPATNPISKKIAIDPPVTAREIQNDKIIITEDDCYDELPFSYPKWKKWSILSVIFAIQVSMNFNAGLYSNGIHGMTKEFDISVETARWGAAVFLVTYAFGCELWAPWSEELGRYAMLQGSMTLINIFQLPVALSKNFTMVMIGRALGGLSMAGGSVTLGMVADMWEANNQQYAVAFVVFSSVSGGVLGPVVGGFVEQYLHWRWCTWIQLIFGVVVQLIHLLSIPETRTTICLDRIAKKRRSAEEKLGHSLNLWGPNEVCTWRERFSLKEIGIHTLRPFKMFFTEPIVFWLSLLSGFADALIFMFIQSFELVYKKWDFNAVQVGLAFTPILIGYFVAWASFIPAIKRNMAQRRNKPEDEKAQYESRLWWLLYTAPTLTIGLIIFAWTSIAPHWIGTMFAGFLIGIANYAIYMATVDYMVCAYGPYSASATGGNGFARDFLAGILTIPAAPFFSSIGGKGNPLSVAYASTILAVISLLLVAAVFVVYFNGAQMRKRSPFAQQIANARSAVAAFPDEDAAFVSTIAIAPGSPEMTAIRPMRPGMLRVESFARLEQAKKITQTMHAGTRSRSHSPAESVRNIMGRKSVGKKLVGESVIEEGLEKRTTEETEIV